MTSILKRTFTLKRTGKNSKEGAKQDDGARQASEDVQPIAEAARAPAEQEENEQQAAPAAAVAKAQAARKAADDARHAAMQKAEAAATAHSKLEETRQREKDAPSTRGAPPVAAADVTQDEEDVLTYEIVLPANAPPGAKLRVPVPGSFPGTSERVIVEVPADAFPGQTISFSLSRKWVDTRVRLRAVVKLQSLVRGKAARTRTKQSPASLSSPPTQPVPTPPVPAPAPPTLPAAAEAAEAVGSDDDAQEAARVQWLQYRLSCCEWDEARILAVSEEELGRISKMEEADVLHERLATELVASAVGTAQHAVAEHDPDAIAGEITSRAVDDAVLSLANAPTLAVALAAPAAAAPSAAMPPATAMPGAKRTRDDDVGDAHVELRSERLRPYKPSTAASPPTAEVAAARLAADASAMVSAAIATGLAHAADADAGSRGAPPKPAAAASAPPKPAPAAVGSVADVEDPIAVAEREAAVRIQAIARGKRTREGKNEEELMAAGFEANRRGEHVVARFCFQGAYEKGAKLEAQVSAANMAIKIGEAHLAQVEYLEVLQRRELGGALLVSVVEKLGRTERLVADADDDAKPLLERFLSAVIDPIDRILDGLDEPFVAEDRSLVRVYDATYAPPPLPPSKHGLRPMRSPYEKRVHDPTAGRSLPDSGTLANWQRAALRRAPPIPPAATNATPLLICVMLLLLVALVALVAGSGAAGACDAASLPAAPPLRKGGGFPWDSKPSPPPLPPLSPPSLMGSLVCMLRP